GPGQDGQHLALAAFPPEVEVEVHGDGHGPQGEEAAVGEAVLLVPLLPPPFHVLDILGIVHMTVYIDFGRPHDDLERCLHGTPATPEGLAGPPGRAVGRPLRDPIRDRQYTRGTTRLPRARPLDCTRESAPRAWYDEVPSGRAGGEHGPGTRTSAVV